MSFEEDLERVLDKGKEQTAEDMLASIEKMYGEEVFYEEAVNIIAVAAAIRCSHCLKLHIRVAKRMGISDDEIGAALLIAGNIANATVLAMATRELNEEKDACPVCQVSGGNGDPMDI